MVSAMPPTDDQAISALAALARSTRKDAWLEVAAYLPANERTRSSVYRALRRLHAVDHAQREIASGHAGTQALRAALSVLRVMKPNALAAEALLSHPDVDVRRDAA